MAKRAPAPKAGDKLTFLLALVPYLIDQVRVSVDEAAAHFGVLRDGCVVVQVDDIRGFREPAMKIGGDLAER